MTYAEFTKRNDGYVDQDTQARIAKTKVLIAGCGIGSSTAEALVRLGFLELVLADGDTIGTNNLNRQNYVAADVGENKAVALARRLKAIQPLAQITVIDEFITPEDADAVVQGVDYVFDTIDYLDLPSIVALHEAARRHQKHVVSALAIGWGAGCLSIPPDCAVTVRQMFGIDENEDLTDLSYIEKFAGMVGKLAPHLDPNVVAVVGRALTVMKDGRPCPAPQVSPGAFAVGALSATVLVRLVAHQLVRSAPEMLLLDIPDVVVRAGIPLVEQAA